MKIMVIDDSKTARYMIIQILREMGYQDFLCCENIDQAKEGLEKEQVDLILSDWHMPRGSGLDLLKWVRASASFSNIPFLMITTEQQKKNIVEAVRTGVQGYLFKPIQKDTLKNKLFELVKNGHIQAPTS